ncbi:hypothetical protein CerSpe_252730 [Prunus speciosa]
MSSRSRREGKGPAFQLSTPFPSFLKIVVQQALQDGKLKIPKMVVMEYGDLMADKIFLEVPDGAVWPVKLTRPCNGEIWMQKGWPEFAKFYSLKHGCLLIFRYEGEHSHFRVRIFMRNTLELEYFSSSTDDEAEGNSNPSSETEGQGNKHDREKRTHGADHGGKSTASEAPLRTFAKTELEDLAYSKALSFKSNNPFFVMKMHLSYLSTHLPISVPFANKHICARGVSSDVTLQISNDERSWPVKCITTVYNGRPRTRFHSFGWGAFVKDNHLEEGDACVFELINKGPDKIAFKVGIFRVEDEE